MPIRVIDIIQSVLEFYFFLINGKINQFPFKKKMIVHNIFLNIVYKLLKPV